MNEGCDDICIETEPEDVESITIDTSNQNTSDDIEVTDDYGEEIEPDCTIYEDVDLDKPYDSTDDFDGDSCDDIDDISHQNYDSDEMSGYFRGEANRIQDKIDYTKRWIDENPNYHDEKHLESLRDYVNTMEHDRDEYLNYADNPQKYYDREERRANAWGYVSNELITGTASSIGADIPNDDVYSNIGRMAYYNRDLL